MAQVVRYGIFEGLPLTQALSTRKGGVSPAPYHSLNMGLRTGDDPRNVEKNRRLFFELLRLRPEETIFQSQVHGDHVRRVSRPGLIPNCDATITDTPGLNLTVQTADCFPLFFYDPRNHACGVAHSGWRGTAQNIAGKTVAAMRRTFGSRPAELLAAVGAGVQPRNYQVDEKTAAHFEPAFLQPDGPGHYKLDVQSAIYAQLLEAGLTGQNIERDKSCTYEAADLFYSYRRDGARSGRMMGVICLR
ncbi:MAG TPA: peptidoglycan editing factor PgeF [Caldithrix abyssi]|uniref:Purine nucleoside phosphorylase n=1 Tax=Caldithrix abyssi TaxID=187145 RepID=A0A7V1PTM9_CALAY|nr:peptidoglycan editing factor PgeF [Caldithrix abyssi]